MREHAVGQLLCGVPTLHAVPQCQALLDKVSRLAGTYTEALSGDSIAVISRN